MIKLLSPEPNGGMPFEIEDLLQIQDGLYSGLAFLCNAAGMPLILSGCDVTTSTATSCTVTAGWVWIEGDFRYFPGYTGNYPFYIVKDVTRFYTKTFENGTVQNALVDAFSKPVVSVTSGQESIAMNPGNDAQRYKLAITSDVSAAVDKINKVLPTKATKSFTAIPWTNITLDSAYVMSINTMQRPQFMLDEFGTVHLRGAVVNDPNSTLVNGSGDIGIGFLPASVVPQNDLRVGSMLVYETGYFANAVGNYELYPDGRVTIQRGAGDIFIGGKAMVSGVQVGQIRCYLQFPTKSYVLASLDGISWNINP